MEEITRVQNQAACEAVQGLLDELLKITEQSGIEGNGEVEGRTGSMVVKIQITTIKSYGYAKLFIGPESVGWIMYETTNKKVGDTTRFTRSGLYVNGRIQFYHEYKNELIASRRLLQLAHSVHDWKISMPA